MMDLMDSNLDRNDAAVLIKNFNNIKDPEFGWGKRIDPLNIL